MSLSSVWYPNSTNLEYVTEPIVQAVQTLSTTAALRGERTGIVDKKGKAVSLSLCLTADLKLVGA